jgi:hypothetical protein
LLALGALGLGLCFGCESRQRQPEYIYGVPNVTAIEVTVSQGMPARVSAVIRGTVRDPCTRIGSVTQELEGRVFTLSLTTRRALEDTCTDVETPFEATIPLVERGLETGDYTAVAGEISTVFFFRRTGTVPDL